MTHNVSDTANTAALSTKSGFTRSIWQYRSAKGETLWSWITWAFTVYWLLFVSGALLNHKALNAVGGVIVLGVLAWVLLERLWVRLDAVVLASLFAAACLPVLQIIAGAPPAPEALFKHVSLCLVMAMARVLDLPVAFNSKMRWALMLQVLAILLISTTIYKGTSWDGGTRHSGLFVNPNNLALIPFLLLFFVNPLKDKLVIRIAVHGIVLAVLAYSGTSGAVMAYAIGMAVHLKSMISKRTKSLVYFAAGVAVVAAAGLFAVGVDNVLPHTRMINQIEVVSTQLHTVIGGGEVAYYEQERVLGSGSASGLWRLMHWRRTLFTYLDGTTAQHIFGFGLGSSPLILGKLPHNEYLRMLFEQGILGLLLFLFAWYRIIKTAPAEVRYIGLIVAIYSFSENNLDNFPFMSLFILCLSARGMNEAIKTSIKQPLVSIWNATAQRV